MRVVELEGVSNVRDLGGIPVQGGRVVSPGLIFRGSALANITPADQETLFGKLGIACVIDLRCGWECQAKPDVLAPGVEYLHIPFYDLDKVGIEYTEPAAGTKIIGRDVACEPDRFYRSLSNELTVGQMREALECTFARALQGKPVYLHCSGGKDRAGIMAFLALTSLGARHADIMEDYLLTNVARDKNYEKTYQRFLRLADGNEQRARELTESHRALPDNIEAFRDAVSERYGSMGEFMRNQLGVTDELRARIRKACTRPV